MRPTALAGFLLAAGVLSGCNSKDREAELQAERQRLEAERVAMAEDRARLGAEQEALERRTAAEAAAKRMAAERERVERERAEAAAAEASAGAEAVDAESKPMTFELTAPIASGPLRQLEPPRESSLPLVAESRSSGAPANGDGPGPSPAAGQTGATKLGAAKAGIEEAAAKPAERTTAFFYDALAPHGDWLEWERYGYVWRPNRGLVDARWRPYTDGRWQWTEHGWTWQSLEPYGWAVYHYGRWLRHPRAGWVWVPGHEWAPGWVVWRVKGSEAVGWAPLPPESESLRSLTTAIDLQLEIGPGSYCFLPVTQFDEPTYVHRFVLPDEHMSVLRSSRNATQVVQRAGGAGAVVTGGPDPGMIGSVIRKERDTPEANPVPRLNLVLSGSPPTQESGGVIAEDGAMLLFAPKVVKETGKAAPKKVGERLTNDEPDRGWSGLTPETEASWRSLLEREAAQVAAWEKAQEAARRNPQPVAPRFAAPPPPPPPKPNVATQAPPPTRASPLNPARLQPAGGLFSR